MSLKIRDVCGPTFFDCLVEYSHKQPGYAEIARTTDDLTERWFVVEFENPNSLTSCVSLNGTMYKDVKLTVRSLKPKEYDDMCGQMDIMKLRTKRFKKLQKGKRLSIVLVSNVSSKVTSDALYKFFGFPGDPIEVAIDRARKVALVAYDTEEQAVVALACDQAILGPAMVRIELYRPDKHGKDLQLLLKVGRTGDITHVGAQTGYVQISEHNTGLGPNSPSISHGTTQAVAPGYYSPQPAAHLSAAPQSSQDFSARPQSAPRQHANVAPPVFNTTFDAHAHAHIPSQHPTYGALPSQSAAHHNDNPFSLGPSTSHQQHQQDNSYARQEQRHDNPYKMPHAAGGVPLGTPQATEDWSTIVPTAKYIVTTEYK